MSGWQKRQVKDFGEIVTGRTPSTKRRDFYEGDYNLISPADLDNGKYIRTAHKRLTKLGFEQCRTLPKGTVLVGCIGNVGKLGMVDNGESATNQQINALICNAEYDPEFVYYCFHENRDKLEKRAVKTTLPILNKTNFGNFEINVPPLHEQKKIAHILSTVQRAIEAQERIIQTTTELKKALMHKLFTEGLRNEPQKQTEIGLVPESWELFSIGDLFETQLGKMLSQKAKIGNSPKVYLRNKNVQWGQIDTEDLLRMDFSDREAEKFLLRKGDLLVCEGGEVGRTALWGGSIANCYYQKALHRLRPKSGQISNEFMVHWMMFAFLLTNTYDVTGTRTTIAHLPEIKLKPLFVPVPPPDEQAKIITVFDTLDQKNAGHQRKLGELQNLFRTLLHELMTAKTRVHKYDFPITDIKS